MCNPACDPVLTIILARVALGKGELAIRPILAERCRRCRQLFALGPGWLRRYLKPPARLTA